MPKSIASRRGGAKLAMATLIGEVGMKHRMAMALALSLMVFAACEQRPPAEEQVPQVEEMRPEPAPAPAPAPAPTMPGDTGMMQPDTMTPMMPMPDTTTMQ